MLEQQTPENLEIFDMHPGVDARNGYSLKSGHNFIDIEVAGSPEFIDETLKKVTEYFQVTKAWNRGEVQSISRRSYHLWHPENRMRTRSIFRTKIDRVTGEPLNSLVDGVTVAYTKEEAFRFFYVNRGNPNSSEGLQPNKYTVWPYMTQELPERSKINIPTRGALVKVARDNGLFLPEAGGYEDSLHEYHTPVIRTMEERDRYGADYFTLETTLDNFSYEVASMAAKKGAGLVWVERIGVNPAHIGFWLGFYKVPWQQKDERA